MRHRTQTATTPGRTGPRWCAAFLRPVVLCVVVATSAGARSPDRVELGRQVVALTRDIGGEPGLPHASTSGDAFTGYTTSVTVNAVVPGTSGELQAKVLDVARRRGMGVDHTEEDLDRWWVHLTGDDTLFLVEVVSGHRGGVPLTVSALF